MGEDGTLRLRIRAQRSGGVPWGRCRVFGEVERSGLSYLGSPEDEIDERGQRGPRLRVSKGV